MNRRRFARRAAALTGGLAAAGLPRPARAGSPAPHDPEALRARYAAMDAAAARPVFRRELFAEPITLASCELLRLGDKFMCRVRDTEGREGWCMSNNHQMPSIWTVATERVFPYFVGKDVTDLDALIADVTNYRSNYKLQNLALWVPVATAEFAILDLLGRIAGLPMHLLVAERRAHDRLAVYRANGHRGLSPEESLERIVATAAEDGARAVKFKIGGRMSAPEVPPDRTQRLVPMVRAAFPDDVALYVDANGSYADVAEAVAMGRFLEANGIDLYEEPCPIDHYEDWLAIARAVDIPVAGGGAEASMRRFRYMMAEGGFQVAQPDPFYFGGLIRSVRVARMAEAAGVSIVPHISGTDLCYLYLLHYVSVVPNAGPFHEFKGHAPADLPFTCATSSLETEDGMLEVPTGPGSGVEYAADYLAKYRVVEG